MFPIEFRPHYAPHYVSYRTVRLTMIERNEQPPKSYRTELDMASIEPNYATLEALTVDIVSFSWLHVSVESAL